MKFKTATTPEFFVICLLILFLDLPFRLRPSPATMSVTQLAAFQELISSMRDLQVSSYTCGAGMVVLLYDFILTIPEEVKYVWSGKQRLSMVRAMYFWNRYFTVPWIIVANYHIAGLRGPLSNQFCKVFIPSLAIVQGVSIAIGIQLLALRVLALYKNSEIVRLGLYTYLAACHITLLVITTMTMKQFVPFLMYLPITKTCYTVPNPLIKFVYIPPIAAECGIMILQAANHIYRGRQRTFLHTPLISTLYRDGYLWFGCVISVRLLCLLVYLFAPVSLWSLSNQLDFPLSTALISRFFLQLRGAVDTDDEDVTLAPHTSVRSNPQHINLRPAVHVDNGRVNSPVPLRELRRFKSTRISRI